MVYVCVHGVDVLWYFLNHMFNWHLKSVLLKFKKRLHYPIHWQSNFWKFISHIVIGLFEFCNILLNLHNYTICLNLLFILWAQRILIDLNFINQASSKFFFLGGKDKVLVERFHRVIPLFSCFRHRISLPWFRLVKMSIWVIHNNSFKASSLPLLIKFFIFIFAPKVFRIKGGCHLLLHRSKKFIIFTIIYIL